MEIKTKETSLESRIQSLLLAVITAGMIGCVGFLWQMKGDFAALQERDRQKTIDIGVVQSSLDKVRFIDMQDLKDRMTRIEAKQNSKP